MKCHTFGDAKLDLGGKRCACKTTSYVLLGVSNNSVSSSYHLEHLRQTMSRQTTLTIELVVAQVQLLEDFTIAQRFRDIPCRVQG